MRKIIIIALLALTACQKEDMQEAYTPPDTSYEDGRVAAITKTIQEQEDRLTGLTTEDEDAAFKLSNIRTYIKNAYANITSLNDETSAIKFKVDEVILLIQIINGPADGYYTVIDQKQKYPDDDWGTWDPEALNQNRFVIEMKDKKVYREGHEKGGRYSLYSSLLHTELHSAEYVTTRYIDDMIIEVTNIDEVTIQREIKVNHRDSFEINYLIQEVVVLKLGEPRAPVYTWQEELAYYREQKSGIYSDSLYASIDPSDPKSYLKAFIKDAERHGLDMSAYNTDDFTFSLLSDENIGWNTAWAQGHCNHTYFFVGYNARIWNSFNIDDKINNRIKVMWHEFGHALFQMHHLYQGGHIMTGRHQNPKVIFDDSEKESEEVTLIWGDPDPSRNFERAIDDLFGMIWYDTWCDDTTGKRNKIIN